jgi:hypothetical protein
MSKKDRKTGEASNAGEQQVNKGQLKEQYSGQMHG